MKAVLFYEPADDVLERAPLHYAAHRAWLDEFHARGSLLMVGPFGDPQAQGSMAVFRDRASAEEFLAGDPFVEHGVVAGWEIRDWDEILVP